MTRMIGVSDETEQILGKNIWELESHIKEGQGDPRSRLALLRAYAQQTAITEEALGIANEDRAYLKVNERSRAGVLLLHGSTGGPSQLRSLAEALHRAGFSVLGARMPAHPASDEQLSSHSWRAWLVEAELRYRMLAVWCRQLHVVGFSFGAAIALQMNVRPRPRSLVLLAPAIHIHLGWRARLALAVGLHRSRWVRRRLGWKVEVLDGIEEGRKSDWWQKTPLYAAICRDDPRVNRSSLGFLRKRSSGKGTVLREFESGGHVFMDQAPKDQLHEEVLNFLRG